MLPVIFLGMNMNKIYIAVVIVIISTLAVYLCQSGNDFVNNIEQADENNKLISSSTKTKNSSVKTGFIISDDNKSKYASNSELSASKVEIAKVNNTAIKKRLENFNVSQVIPTPEFIESYTKFETLVKEFNSSGNHQNNFDNSEIDLEWTLRMEDIIYNQMKYIPETGEERFTNIELNEVDCRSSMCKLNVRRLDLSIDEEQIAQLSSYLLGSESKLNANDYRTVITDNHKDGSTSFYFSRSVNDSLKGNDRE